MKPGYLRRNGVPYSADAIMTEYLDRFDVPAATRCWSCRPRSSIPTYLAQPYWTSSHFKKQSDTSGWNPTPCSAVR